MNGSRPTPDVIPCRVKGCTRRPRSKSSALCEMHYYRMRRTGSLGEAESTRRQPGHCRHRECDRRDSGEHGWCRLHLERIRAHGDPDVVGRAEPTPGALHPQWQGEDVGYGAVHSRLRKERGRASDHPCVGCGGPADHWSYDHDDPAEKHASDGPYSTDLDHYSPRCVSCHKRFDLARVA